MNIILDLTSVFGRKPLLNEQRLGSRRVAPGRRQEDHWQGVCRRVEQAPIVVRDHNTNVFGLRDAREERQAQIDKAKLQTRIDAIVRKR